MSYDLALIEALAKIAEAVGEINTNYDPQSLLDALKTVDGDGSGLDADMVDGQHIGRNYNLNTRDISLRQDDCMIKGGGHMVYIVDGVETMRFLGHSSMYIQVDGDTKFDMSNGVVDITGALTVNGQPVCVGCNDIVSQATPAFTQTIPPGVWTVVEYGMIVYNPVGAYNSATYQFVAPEDGFYHVQAAVNWDVNGWSGGEIVRLELFRNGENLRTLDENQVDRDWNTIPGVAAAFYLNGGCDVWLSAGSAIDIRVWHNAGASVDTYRYYDRYNRFSVHKIS